MIEEARRTVSLFPIEKEDVIDLMKQPNSNVVLDMKAAIGAAAREYV